MADVLILLAISPTGVTYAGEVAHPTQQQGLPVEGIEAVESQEGGVHAEPNVLGIDATILVSIAMAVLIGVIIWRRVPTLIAASLDNRIADIRAQLDDAKSLRAEAEALRAQYDDRLTAFAGEAEAMRASARAEADQIVAKAKADTDALIARRRRMAEDRIAAAERQAVADLRAQAAEASAAAAARLLADRMDGEADRAMQDRAIGALGTLGRVN